MNEKYPLALPEGSVLAGQYIIQKTLGQGGFGITYMALDHKTGAKVAVKEFFPDTLATRTQTTVVPYTGERGDSFNYGLGCFLQEAETLAEFIGIESIVKIHSYFEENGTAYFVMDFIEGQSFDEYLKEHGGKISYNEAEEILIKVMDALGAVHEKGIVHRDVTPDNIYITKSGEVKLLDFGAARYSLGDKSRSLDVVLKHGFAPKEQYTRRGKQGPFTDVYSLGATFYFAITGKRPPDSIDRIDEDELVPPSALGVKLPQIKEDAILTAMAVQPADRFQSMANFKRALLSANSMLNNESPVQQRYFTAPDNTAQQTGYDQTQATYNQIGYGQTQAAYNQTGYDQTQMGYGQNAYNQAGYDQTQMGYDQNAYNQTGYDQTQMGYGQNAYNQAGYGQTQAVYNQTSAANNSAATPKKKKNFIWLIPVGAGVVAIVGLVLVLTIGIGAIAIGSKVSSKDVEEVKTDYAKEETNPSDAPSFEEIFDVPTKTTTSANYMHSNNSFNTGVLNYGNGETWYYYPNVGLCYISAKDGAVCKYSTTGEITGINVIDDNTVLFLESGIAKFYNREEDKIYVADELSDYTDIDNIYANESGCFFTHKDIRDSSRYSLDYVSWADGLRGYYYYISNEEAVSVVDDKVYYIEEDKHDIAWQYISEYGIDGSEADLFYTNAQVSFNHIASDGTYLYLSGDDNGSNVLYRINLSDGSEIHSTLFTDESTYLSSITAYNSTVYLQYTSWSDYSTFITRLNTRADGWMESDYSDVYKSEGEHSAAYWSICYDPENAIISMIGINPDGEIIHTSLDADFSSEPTVLKQN